uniref:Putative Hydrogenase maturation protease HupD/HybD n=1 Tax=Magnetococcus massalia (strain MO-1) TaxID=451514 RepID=A0A1S7LGA5_MAGMO|nr:putative Hydrogenase maturation protease HupD/HybD [Candidatus Magnetococcus massalia]
MAEAITLIMGIGNIIQKDEGIGVVAVRQLQQHLGHLEHLHFVDGGTIGFALAPLVEQCRQLIVIDATRFKATPGTVGVWHNEEIDARFRSQRGSVHELGLLDMLDMVRLSGQIPEQRVLIGVEPQLIEMGEGLTEPLQAALPEIMDKTVAYIDQWHAEDHAGFLKQEA